MENSIEEDIKILKELGQEYYKNGEIKIKALSGAKYIWALQNLLSDYKRVLKENEELLELKVSASAHNRILELEKENKELKEINNKLEAEKNEAIRRYNFEAIPIQKVKDNIEELKKNLYTVEHYETVGAINALQELLERRK